MFSRWLLSFKITPKCHSWILLLVFKSYGNWSSTRWIWKSGKGMLFSKCRHFPTWLSYALYMYMSRGGGRAYSEEFWRGCAAWVVATKPLATETEGQNRMLGYGKWVKIKPLTLGNVTKLTTFEAILHAIGQIWPKSCHSLRKKWWNYVKIRWKYILGYGGSVKIRTLATEI